MKFELHVTCECGNQDVLIPKRTFVEYEGKVYEDYSSITDGEFKNGNFTKEQYCEDLVEFTCKCGKKHELWT